MTDASAAAPAVPPTLDDELYPASHYGKVMKKLLPADAFKPQPGRLWFGFMHMSIVVAMGYLCLGTSLPIALKVLAAIVAGHSHAILGFFAHEVWHYSVLKKGPLEHWLGGFFSILNAASPTAWKLWHNQTHHKLTGIRDIDPDALPFLETVRRETPMRWVGHIVPGRGLLAYFTPFTTFTLDYNYATFQLLTATSHGNAKGFKIRIVLETLLLMAPWAALFYFFGWPAVILCNLIPHAIANWVNMMYIHSNHHLSPRTTVNDPLVNSLTVTLPKALQWFHGNFGFHVEHHLFPSLSTRFAPELATHLRETYGARYQSMSFPKAIKRLYQTGTCYSDDGDRLVDMRDGSTRFTLRAGRTDFAPGPVEDISLLKDGSSSPASSTAEEAAVVMDVANAAAAGPAAADRAA